jgi:hypothetical protein
MLPFLSSSACSVISAATVITVHAIGGQLLLTVAYT